jgi:tetratricopeptide (TPR) repeat protein
VAVDVAARWIRADPGSIDARRAAARAALDLHRIEPSVRDYRIILDTSPRGRDVEFELLETELENAENIFGARQVADRLAAQFPASAAALRMQGFTALRADDPAAAVRSFTAALALPAGGDPAAAHDANRELTQGLWRARILAGDVEEPLAQAQEILDHDDTSAHRLDYAVLLLAAQRNSAAAAQLQLLRGHAESAPVALRLLGLVDFQEGRLDEASVRFMELLTTGKFLDDAFYYLGVIAERHEDLERALRLYAQVQNGGNAVPALLRAAAILRAHGAAPAAEQLLDQLAIDEPQRAPEILAARARICADAGDMRQAIDVLHEGTLQYPDSVELRYAMASTYEEQGNISAALRELKAVVKLRPDDPAALNAFGYTLADQKRSLARARALIERAYASAPKNAAILDSFGWVLYRQGHGEQALTYLNAAYAEDRSGDIAAHLGEVLWQLGRRADADRIWSDANAIDAGNRVLKDTRLRLHSAN